MTKEKEITIDSINLKIGNREIILTISEARKLKSALDDLFKTNEVWRWYPNTVYVPAPQPCIPKLWEVTYCTKDSDSTACLSYNDNGGQS